MSAAEAQREVERREAELSEARARRDALIRQEIAAGKTAYRLAQETGIARSYIQRVRDAA